MAKSPRCQIEKSFSKPPKSMVFLFSIGNLSIAQSIPYITTGFQFVGVFYILKLVEQFGLRQ
jgi:hypothetical protein